ncbi:type I-E CRISPR-associated protein Cas6/Cse3/CasE [uncultured Methanolobus sp.]|uniref:type I-E CRISPR-associated protein Cas6/Cse3/CasE n=1 Tax=uncultured Methanolobus sp. TaxID=218300 RepID=UPI002AAC39FD|nr:type I-E CRISPR-associated protein Cas6/Cse3/CasE [uncultured Methanolobus sp.]
MYFSRWLLKSKRPTDPYQLHRKIWQLFPNKADDERSFLFRIENKGQYCEQIILLQSECQPDITSNELLLLNGPKEIDFDIKSENSYQFMLRANPTKKIKDKNGKPGNQGKVRVPLIEEDEIVAWLKRQLSDCAEIEDVKLIHKDLLRFHKNKKGDKHIGKIQTVTFLGVLTVTNSDLLINKIMKGLGPAKSFGCGLLTLAKT